MDEIKLLVIHFRSTTPFVIKSPKSHCKEIIAQFRKFYLYYSLPEFERDKDNPPYVLYHLLDEAGDMIAIILFTEVISVCYQDIQEEKGINA